MSGKRENRILHSIPLKKTYKNFGVRRHVYPRGTIFQLTKMSQFLLRWETRPAPNHVAAFFTVSIGLRTQKRFHELPQAVELNLKQCEY